MSFEPYLHPMYGMKLQILYAKYINLQVQLEQGQLKIHFNKQELP